MKKIHLHAVSVALASVSALAISTAAQAQVPNWTGFYVGAYAGGAWGHSDAVTNAPCTATSSPPGYFCTTTVGLANGLAVSAAGTGSMSGSGFTGGGQLGYNWQINNVVYGLETDFGAFKLDGSRQASAHYPVGVGIVSPAYIFTVGSSFNTNWLFTARGRLGWTSSNMLFYGTGGLALTRLEVSQFFTDTNTPPFAMGGSNAATKVGWTLGGGVEWALNKNWSAKAEYLYVDFGSVTVNSTGTGTYAGTGYSQAISTSADLTAHIARVGVNYKF
jgi:outer membrane immunogenic protein